MTPPDVPVSIRLQAPTRPLQPRALHRAALHGRSEPERSATPVGTVDSGTLADVDEAGAVQLRGATWCLDWWIGAEDRWHHPAREAAVRQRSIDLSPVVETALRVPGGDVLARVCGVQASAGEWRGPAVVVEVENRTAVPVALAFVVRPVTLDGTGSVRTVRSEGTDVLVGSDRLLLSRVAPRVVTGRLGEVADRLAAGRDTSGPVDLVEPGGDAEVAFVVPLTHTAVARVLLPVTGQSVGRRGAPSPTGAWDAPDAAAVARGWAAHRSEDLRIDVPEPGWGDGLVWSASMLRLAGPDEVGACMDRRRVPPAGPPASVRAAEVAEAMSRVGATDALAPIARGLAGAQRLSGGIRLGDRSDGTVALLHAAAGALTGVHDPRARIVEEVLGSTAVAVHRVRRGHGLADDLAASAARALRMLVPSLEAIGQPDVAHDAAAVAATLGSSNGHRNRPGGLDPAPTAGPSDLHVTVDAALTARALIAERRGAEGVAAVRACWSGAEARGRSDVELLAGQGQSPVPGGVLGFDVAELAARTNALLDVFVADGATGPELLSVFDRSWYGYGVEAHGIASPWGEVGVAVRWHGARPALLWQVGVSGRSGLEVTAPGLDPTWRGTGASGDALLAEP